MDIEKEVAAFAASLSDYADCARGFKVLKLDNLKNPKITGSHQTAHVWYPRDSYEPMKAVCTPGMKKSPLVKSHEAPGPPRSHNLHNFDCGFYSHYRMEELIAREYPKIVTSGNASAWKVMGVNFIAVVEGGGQVYAHKGADNGWRAEYCRLAAFVRPTEDLGGAEEPVHTLLGSIALELEIPYLSREDAQEFAETLGVDLTPEA